MSEQPATTPGGPSGPRRGYAVVLVLSSILAVQVGASWAKSLFETAGPLTMVFLRQASAGIVLWVIFRPKWRGHSRRDWLILAGYTGFVVLMNFSFYHAMAAIPVGMTVTFEFLGPLAVAIITGRGWRDYLWALLAAVGVAILGWSSEALNFRGVAFALVAAACWAGYILISPQVGARWRGVDAVAYANAAGAVVLLLPVLTLHAEVLSHPVVWGVGLAVGLLNSVIPYTFELQALRHLEKGIFSIMMSLEPACAAAMGFLILGERLAGTDILAMGCIMVASVGVTWRPRQSTSN